MKTLRMLWAGYHRVARFEEVNSFLRAGVEVVPVAGTHAELPNAQDPPESEDPLYPRWQGTCTAPSDVVYKIRNGIYAAEPPRFPGCLRDEINRWFDVILVTSFTRVVAEVLNWFQGQVILRAYGNYPYSGVLRPGTVRGEAALFRLAACDRFIFCPAMPYLGLHEDPRVTRNEHYVQAGVSPERLPEKWRGRKSAPIACDVISLIGKYRQKEYQDFLRVMDGVPLRILGINPPGGPAGSDLRIAGAMEDALYYQSMASSRVLPYLGLNTKLHLHYHPIEAMLMGLPVLFVADGSIAHMARYHHFTEEDLVAAGMCSNTHDMATRTRRLVESADEALNLSLQQTKLRSIFNRACMDQQISSLADKLRYRAWYSRTYGRAPADASLSDAARAVTARAVRAVGRRFKSLLPSKVRS